jgi:putative Mg2+ transporter-C (MgtC) family protein
VSEFWVTLSEQDALLKLFLSLMLGGLIGLEREWHGRAAGLRTHVMVCLGSTILLIAAKAASEAFSGTGNVVLDPNRIAAGIVTGIGFLGGGAIIRMGDLIRGLTTAACIWFVAALGIVIGNGLFVLAIFTTLVVLLVLIVFDMFEHYIPPVIYRTLTIRIDPSERKDFEKRCSALLKETGIRVQECLSRVNIGTGVATISFRVRLRGRLSHGLLLDAISEEPGVRFVGWEQDPS